MRKTLFQQILSQQTDNVINKLNIKPGTKHLTVFKVSNCKILGIFLPEKVTLALSRIQSEQL